MRILARCLTATTALGMLAAPALAVEISVQEVSQARVVPKNAKQNASIAAAVEISRRLSAARSVAAGRKRAARAAVLLGTPLDPLSNIGATGQGSVYGFTPFGFSPFGGAPLSGEFGPGKYCGVKTFARGRVDAATGKRVVTRTRRRVCSVPKFAYDQVSLTFGRSAPPDGPTITATGSAVVNVIPKNPKNNASIAKAVASSRDLAMRRGIAAARARARLLAGRGSLQLGSLAIARDLDTGISFFGPGGPTVGAFGRGKYCKGVVAKVRKRDPKTGKKTGPTRTVRRLTCRIPKKIYSNWTLTYNAAP